MEKLENFGRKKIVQNLKILVEKKLFKTRKFWISTRISDHNFYFTEYFIGWNSDFFDKNYDFLKKFRFFLTRISIFWKKFRFFLTIISIFWPNFILIFYLDELCSTSTRSKYLPQIWHLKLLKNLWFLTLSGRSGK